MTDNDKLQELVRQASPLRLERRLLRMERSVLKAEYRSYPEGLRQLHTLKDTLEAAQIRLRTARAYLAASTPIDDIVNQLQRVNDAGKKLLELEADRRALLKKIAPLTEDDLPPLVQKRQALRAAESRLEELNEEIDLIELEFQNVVYARARATPEVLSSGRCRAPARYPLMHRFATPQSLMENEDEEE